MKRAAIFFVPEGKMALLGGSWLGHNLRTDHGTTKPEKQESWLKSPQKYGFHATIKAPFRTNDNQKPADIANALRKLCANHAPMALPLHLDISRPMVALRSIIAPPALKALEADIVTGLDSFRAPLSEAELARRNPNRLSRYQRAMLACWGYPHVLQAFDFHLTLTGVVPPAERQAVHAVLQERFGTLNEPLHVRALSLCVEDDAGWFHWVCDAPLTGGTSPEDNPAAAQP